MKYYSTFLLVLLAILSANAQRGGSSTQGIPQEAIDYNSNGDSELDSIERADLEVYIKSLSLNDEKNPYFDSLRHHVQRIEPYYETNFINGNLGSENSAAYLTQFQYQNSIGLDLGYDQYEHLFKSLGRFDIYDVNRSLWAIHYQKGYGISNGNVEIDFNRRFNKDLLLNFNYDNYSDNSWLGNQENELGNLDLKLYQDLGDRKRKSYLMYSRTKMTEEHSRTLFEGENATSERTSVLAGIGNRLVLSSDSLGRVTFLRNEILFSGEQYGFVDGSVSSTEAEYYGIEDDRSTIDFGHSISSFSVNSYIEQQHFNKSYGAWINLSTQSLTYTIDTLQAFQLDAGLNYNRTLANKAKLDLSAQLVWSEYTSDIAVKADYTQALLNRDHAISLSLDGGTLSPQWKDQIATFDSTLTLWDNDFSNTAYLKFKGTYHLHEIAAAISLETSLYSNPVLYSRTGRPFQSNDQLFMTSLAIHKDLNFWIFKSEHHLLLQYINSVFVPRPDVQLNGNLSIDFKLFKSGLKSRIGVDYYFIPSFATPSFNPLFGSFYNDLSGDRSNHILIMNPYASFRVDDNFQFYFKTSNALSQLVGTDFYQTKDYNIYNYRISFGIKWRLLD